MNLKIGDIVQIKRTEVVGHVREIQYIKYNGVGNKPKDWIEHEVYVDTNSKWPDCVIDNYIFYFPFELKVLHRKKNK